jgi:hypothetical protein
MKIVLNTQNINLQNDFLVASKDISEIIIAKAEKMLFDTIKIGDVNAFVLDNNTLYIQKAIDFIKKKHPYIPVIILGNEKITNINNADIYISYIYDHSFLFNIIIKNLVNYENNFFTLQRLTAKITKKVYFGVCMYDPNRRMIYHQNKEILKISEKSGGILEMLASNYGKIVKKDLILERVWRKNDYYSSRSMDVYVTGLRKIFRENNIDIKIKNISGVGLILE